MAVRRGQRVSLPERWTDAGLYLIPNSQPYVCYRQWNRYVLLAVRKLHGSGSMLGLTITKRLSIRGGYQVIRVEDQDEDRSEWGSD